MSNVNSSVYEVRQGDNSPAAMAKLANYNGDPIDPPDEVWFVMIAPGATQPKVYARGTIVDVEKMQVKYEWGVDDTDTAGEFYAYWRCRYSDSNKWSSVPNYTYDIVRVLESFI